jgi:hypothetical protein
MCLLRHTAIFADTHSIIFLTASVHLLSCLVYLGRSIAFVPHFIALTSQLVLARSLAGQIFFARGKAVAGHAQLFVRALCLARLPLQTPHAWLGRAWSHRSLLIVQLVRLPNVLQSKKIIHYRLESFTILHNR